MSERRAPTSTAWRFTIDQSMKLLRNTPGTLSTLLGTLPEEWLPSTEGPGIASPLDVLGHLIHADETDWIPRARIIAGDGTKAVPTFDRAAMLFSSQRHTVKDLLATFARVRVDSLNTIGGMRLEEAVLSSTAIQPDSGEVMLRQHLAAWAVHDLDHLSQISRSLAKRYGKQVGPLKDFLRVLK